MHLLGTRLTKQNKHELVKDTSMIFQQFNLLNNLTVVENVMLPNKLRGISKNFKKRAMELLEFVGWQISPICLYPHFLEVVSRE